MEKTLEQTNQMNQPNQLLKELLANKSIWLDFSQDFFRSKPFNSIILI